MPNGLTAFKSEFLLTSDKGGSIIAGPNSSWAMDNYCVKDDTHDIHRNTSGSVTTGPIEFVFDMAVL